MQRKVHCFLRERNFNMSSLVTYLYVISGPNLNLEEAVGKYEL